jgi:hypothetical protein
MVSGRFRKPSGRAPGDAPWAFATAAAGVYLSPLLQRLGASHRCRPDHANPSPHGEPHRTGAPAPADGRPIPTGPRSARARRRVVTVLAIVLLVLALDARSCAGPRRFLPQRPASSPSSRASASRRGNSGRPASSPWPSSSTGVRSAGARQPRGSNSAASSAILHLHRRRRHGHQRDQVGPSGVRAPSASPRMAS